MTDSVLVTMASELREALVARGLDPTDPPGGLPPTGAAWAEYRRRGGTAYTDPAAFGAAGRAARRGTLPRRVKNLALGRALGRAGAWRRLWR